MLKKGMWHSAGTLAGLIAAAIGLAGCGIGPLGSHSGSDATPQRQASPPRTSQPPAQGTPSTSTYDVKTAPGSTPGYVGAFKDTKLTGCTSADGGTDVSGTVSNPTDNVQEYRIYVSVLADTETIGLSEIDLTVDAGKTADWSGHLKTGDSTARCVLRVERNRA